MAPTKPHTNKLDGVTFSPAKKPPGRPKQEAEKTGADKLIDEVREKTPPTFTIPQHRGWQKKVEQEEARIEQEEAEAVLAARSERLKAIEQENMMLRVNRNIGLRMGALALKAASVMDLAVTKLNTKLNDTNVTVENLNKTVLATTRAIQIAQNAMESIVKVERVINRTELPGDDSKAEEFDDLDEEGALQLLNNLRKQLGVVAHNKIIEAEVENYGKS